eukprot:1338039-Rhodomonas_salina.3
MQDNAQHILRPLHVEVNMQNSGVLGVVARSGPTSGANVCRDSDSQVEVERKGRKEEAQPVFCCNENMVSCVHHDNRSDGGKAVEEPPVHCGDVERGVGSFVLEGPEDVERAAEREDCGKA